MTSLRIIPNLSVPPVVSSTGSDEVPTGCNPSPVSLASLDSRGPAAQDRSGSFEGRTPSLAHIATWLRGCGAFVDGICPEVAEKFAQRIGAADEELTRLRLLITEGTR